MPLRPATMVLGNLKFNKMLLCVSYASSFVNTALKKSGIDIPNFPTIKATKNTMMKLHIDSSKNNNVFLFININYRPLDLIRLT